MRSLPACIPWRQKGITLSSSAWNHARHCCCISATSAGWASIHSTLARSARLEPVLIPLGVNQSINQPAPCLESRGQPHSAPSCQVISTGPGQVTESPKTGKEEQESPFKDHCAQAGKGPLKGLDHAGALDRKIDCPAGFAGPVKGPTIPRRHAGRRILEVRAQAAERRRKLSVPHGRSPPRRAPDRRSDRRLGGGYSGGGGCGDGLCSMDALSGVVGDAAL